MKSRPGQGEDHLFILWQNARHKEKEILDDLGGRFEVKNVLEVHWSPGRALSNLQRFYGIRKVRAFRKMRRCGRGAFLVVVVRDPRPEYGRRTTFKGEQTVNVNTFDAKISYRGMTGEIDRVHATVVPGEFPHDAGLLFGPGWEPARSWDGSIAKMTKDIEGSDGWKDIHHLLGTLNKCHRYVVLRNFDELEKVDSSSVHPDIDLLVADREEAKRLLNGRPSSPDPRRVHYHVPVGGRIVRFDLRHVGDGYYDERWAQEILENRVFDDSGFYRPDDLNHFYSLLYHAIVHKPAISPDYRELLERLLENVVMGQRDQDWKEVLDTFMVDRGYGYTTPKDPSVYVDMKVIGGTKSLSQRLHDLKRLTARSTKAIRSRKRSTGA